MHLASAAFLIPSGDDVLRAAQLALEACWHYHQNEREQAADMAEELLTPGHPGATAWVRTCAGWVAASVAFDEDREDLALVFLRKAIASAAECRDIGLCNMVTSLRDRPGSEG